MEKKKDVKRIEINSKEFRINIAQLQKDMSNAYDSMTSVFPKKVKNLKVEEFEEGGHIVLPKEFVGKKAVVLIKKR